jgi:hypothetical protein
MEYLEVSQEDFENPNLTEGNVDEYIDNFGLKSKAKKTARKTKRVNKRFARKTKRAVKKGNTAKVAKLARKKVSKISIKTGKVAKRAERQEKIKKIASKLNPALLPLIPLKGLMVKALNNKGVTTKKEEPLDVIAKKFYNNIVVKHNKHYEEVHFDSDLEPDYVVGSAITGIVTAVISFIKDLKKKKEAEGEEALTPTEKVIVKQTENVEAQIQEKSEAEAARQVGSTLLYDRNFQIGLVFVIALAFIMLRKK